MRPLFRYFGGKAQQARAIADLVDAIPHDRYVESFGGAASGLLHKLRRDREVLNDVDGDVVSVYRVLRDSATADRLRTSLFLTPFSRDEFEDAWHGEATDDEVERARRLIVRGALSFGTGHLPGEDIRGTGFRDYSGTGRTLPAHDFATYPAAIPLFVARFRGVLVERRDAVDLMRRHDCPRTLHHVDPLYVKATRGNRRGYAHDLDDAGHARLLDCLRGLKGHVVLSGYRSALYDAALGGWRRVDREYPDQGRRSRLESLWLSPSVETAAGQMDLALA